MLENHHKRRVLLEDLIVAEIAMGPTRDRKRLKQRQKKKA